ncbi:endonuclease/exonuclease/phosphatase family protein [Blastopirellula marina]|uniref:Endonuclease n=1 Tax=Blastopirellula marina TaxID=124 RepID=A0A2S8FWE7_9BACT|nr:endonuclease/exonuclease/phosphatase family protein [Blastopirellula marina]PQO36483.1 endonuclease [Blastopirellula marina]PTL44320.1 endonuclease [Blastopirellula marina]
MSLTRNLLSLAAALLCAASAFAAEPQPLRVLSYNIHHGEGMDHKIDLPRLAGVIKSVSPDLVLLQEVDRNVKRSGEVDQIAELAKLTGMQFAFGGNLSLGDGKYGNAILSRFPLEDVENHLLPNGEGGEQRGVLSAVVKLPESLGGVECRVLAAHLDHRPGDADRLASVDAIAKWLGEEDRLAILGGDFNATPESEVLKKFREWWTPAGTQETPTIPVAKPTRQIDFVGYRYGETIKVGEAVVLDEPVASDHRPILATFFLQAE